MMLRWLALRRSPLPAASLLVLVSLAAAAEPTPGGESFHRAFDFASAIEADPKDRASAQHAVVADLAEHGDPSAALALAEKIDGWRKAAAIADVAAVLARAGKAEAARAALAEVAVLRGSIEGWQGPRVDAHRARAQALLGDLDATTQLAKEIGANDPRQYAGQATAWVASAQLARGDADAALATLATMDADADIEIAWARTLGYLEAAEADALAPAIRRRALAAAGRSTETVAGWHRIEALDRVAGGWLALGEKDEALRVLRGAEEIVRGVDPEVASKAAFLSLVARTWARVGDKAHAGALLEEAASAVPRALVIDRPALHAHLGESWFALNDPDRAWAAFDQALAAAEGLVNARPRALAAVEICRALGRTGVALPPKVADRLEALRAGLKAPW